MKKIRYLIEATLLWTAFFIFRLLPTDKASDLGGWIGRTIGPRLAASRKAVTNIMNAFPDMPGDEAQTICTDMWDNLGRVIAEYPHLRKIVHHYVELAGEEHLLSLGPENPCVIIGGHLANWELQPAYFSYKINWPTTCVFRAPNNPYVEKLLERCRDPEKRSGWIAKSPKGAREIVNTVRKGEQIMILIDQKYNEGIPVEFFGRPAMTSPSFVKLAENYDVPILPLQIERLKGCHFRLTIHPPFRTEGRGEEEIILQAHTLLEDWIAKRPGQWLWLHRRWDSAALR